MKGAIDPTGVQLVSISLKFLPNADRRCILKMRPTRLEDAGKLVSLARETFGQPVRRGNERAGAEEQGVRSLSLSVECDNPAVSLYTKFGFERYADVANAWTMVKRLDV